MMQRPAHRDTEDLEYQIRLRGQLDQRWSDWFGGLTLINQTIF
jgi:hypothetical protein